MASKLFWFTTQRAIAIEADTEEEASRMVQAELHDGETVLSVEEEEAGP